MTATRAFSRRPQSHGAQKLPQSAQQFRTDEIQLGYRPRKMRASSPVMPSDNRRALRRRTGATVDVVRISMLAFMEIEKIIVLKTINFPVQHGVHIARLAAGAVVFD